MPHRLAVVGLLVLALGAVAACGSDDDDGSASTSESSDTTAADLYVDAGEIPQKVDVKEEEFDSRYNDVIAEAQQP